VPPAPEKAKPKAEDEEEAWAGPDAGSKSELELGDESKQPLLV
jgi:hypothetical protein